MATGSVLSSSALASQRGEYLGGDLAPDPGTADGATGRIDHVENVHRLGTERLHPGGRHVQPAVAERAADPPEQPRGVVGAHFREASSSRVTLGGATATGAGDSW